MDDKEEAERCSKYPSQGHDARILNKVLQDSTEHCLRGIWAQSKRIYVKMFIRLQCSLQMEGIITIF